MINETNKKNYTNTEDQQNKIEELKAERKKTL
jgi:hypothetical protein